MENPSRLSTAQSVSSGGGLEQRQPGSGAVVSGLTSGHLGKQE